MDLFSVQEPSKAHRLEYLIVAAMGFFFFRLVLFATQISHYVPPDEVSHYGFCRIFSETLLLPQDSEKTYSLGLITHVPYLYFYVMGKILWLNFFPLDDLIFARITNCLFSMGTVWFAYRWIALLTSDRLRQFLFVVLLTNTPMFTLICSSVTYDNFTNLFAVTSLYYLQSAYELPTVRKSLFFFISILGGCLTKTAFIPLAAFFLLLFLFALWRWEGFRSIFSRESLLRTRWPEQTAATLVLTLLILNLALYGENLVRYGKLVPGADQVLHFEDAMKFRIFSLETLPFLYGTGKMSWEEAWQRAERIDHRHDRGNTFHFLHLAREHKLRPRPHMDRFRYMGVWGRSIVEGMFGIAGHLFMFKDPRLLTVYQAVLVAGVLFWIGSWKKTGSGRGRFGAAAFLCILYSLVLAQLVSYNWYTRTHFLGVNAQGKYFFPVLVPFYGGLAYYLLEPFGRKTQWMLAAAVGCFFVWGDLPYFFRHATEEWFFH